MKKRRILCLIFAVTLLLALVTSCAGDGGAGGGTDDAEVNLSGEIVMFTWFGDILYEEMLAVFHERNPDATVILEQGSNSVEDYLQVQRLRFLSGENVDITAVRPESMVDYVEAGFLFDLTGQPFLDNYEPAMINALKVDGRIYGIPCFLDTVAVFYNVDKFEEYGWEPATNIYEFYELCQAIRDAGYIPLMNGAADGWPIEFDVYLYFHDIIANDPTIFDRIKTGEASYTDPVFIDAFERVRDFYAMGFIGEETLGVDYGQAATAFAQQQTIMFLHGSWLEGSFVDPETRESILEFEYRVFPLPHNRPGEPQFASTSFHVTYSVASFTENLDLALAWMDWLSSLEANIMMDATAGNFMPIRNFESPRTEKWADILANPNVVNFFYNEQTPGANAELIRVLQLMFLDLMTPQEAAEAVQLVQERGQ